MGALEPGSVFAGYTIERLLGVGGMGEVYVARHPRLPRSDAIKVLGAQFTRDESYRRRFEREADLAASLSHPGIVSVHDRGEFDGRLWIALALIDGVDVSALLASAPGGLPNAEVARAITAVADALDYAGARGLVHRDVKPANILLARTGHFLLTDFGIARMGPESSDLTGTGMTIGTIAYASPEQMQGLPVEPRSDQYALAATAFHLLTGAQPFTGTSPVAVIMAHAQQPVPSVRERRPGLAPQVDAVFARAMAKSPQERFATSKEFAAALGHALSLPGPHGPGAGSPADRLAPTVVNPGAGASGSAGDPGSPRHSGSPAHSSSPGHPSSPAHPGSPGHPGSPAYPGSPAHPGSPGHPGSGLPAHSGPPVYPGSPARPAPIGASPRRSRVPLVFGGVVLAIIVAIGAALGIQAYQRSTAGAEEAAQLPRRPVTPVLPALDTRPDQPVWALPEVTGPPGARTLDVQALGGDSDIVLFARTVRVGSADRTEYLEIVDANTGRLVDGTAPIPVDTGDRSLHTCVVSTDHSAAACELSGRTGAVMVVDVATSAIVTMLPARGDVLGLTAAGDRFVFLDEPDRPRSPQLRALGRDGRELAPLSASDIDATTPSGEPRHGIEVFDKVGLAFIHSGPDASNPLSKWEFRVIRLEDGAEILRRESVEPLDRDTWNVFIDGFMLDDGETHGIYDRNGTKTADLPSGWRPSERPYPTEGGTAETSVPIVFKTDGNKTTYAGVSPRNGIVLWEQQSYSADDKQPERLLFHGVGTLITTYEMSRLVDAYSGEYAISAASPDDCTILGTDGTRIAIARDYGSSGNRLEVWDSKGQAWEVTSEHMAVAVGGKIYLGNLRLF
ncbi:serine/threonine-protein kinase [Nocardia cyriacigeorgica]|uniref:serine/threonine-protein kinase n=1 Tax=Nocardia cyriacigeorgica TaxID=135487 RepID=UPI002803B3D7|nr:protein kinase [Nocardia cyriacigeorgica]